MKKKSSYEKLIRMMQEQGAVNNSYEIRLGVMTGTDSLDLGDLKLEKEDLLIAEHLTKPVLTKLDFTINSDLTWTDKSEYIKPLKKGDVVAVSQLDDDTFAVLERVVEL